MIDFEVLPELIMVWYKLTFAFKFIHAFKLLFTVDKTMLKLK